jgi:hypothetical protein
MEILDDPTAKKTPAVRRAFFSVDEMEARRG